MVECITSSVLQHKMKKNEPTRMQTMSDSVYEGTIDTIDCLGVLFIPKDKHLDPAYVLYTDIKKFMLPEH